MLSPTSRLLELTALSVLPVFTLVGLNVQLLPIAAIFVAIFIAGVVRDAVQLNTSLKQMKVQSDTTVVAFKDRPFDVSLRVDLPSPLHQTDLALELPATFSPSVPFIRFTSSAQDVLSLVPTSRGDFSISSAYVCSPSRWKLWQLQKRIPIILQIKVFPDLSKDPASRQLFSTLQQGQQVQRVVGRGREVERLRDYAAGDSFDEIYWKATARRGHPVSKVFQVERTQDIYAIVDASRLGSRNQALERFVTSSLLLAVAAEKNNDNFGLLTFREKVEGFVRASHGKSHFHRCREAIFDLQPETVSPDFAELFTFINLQIRKRALLFFLTDLSDPLLAENFARDAVTVTRRHVVMVDQIADAADRPLFKGALPLNDAEIQSRLAGHLHWAKLRELQRSLSHIGVNMQLLRPEHTSTELIGQYKSIKQRQML